MAEGSGGSDADAPQPPLEESGQSDQSGQSGESGHEDTGTDLARSIARGLAGRTPRQRPRTDLPTRRRRVEPQATGAHPDDRDPQPLEVNLGRMIAERGWESDLRVHGVFARWGSIVGRDVAAHVTPESYADGRLVVRTDSTAWATEMRLLAPHVVRRLNEQLGEQTVTVIDVEGPRGPSWRKGRLRVKGRGPRDTYG